jgi:hypothetical protein
MPSFAETFAQPCLPDRQVSDNLSGTHQEIKCQIYCLQLILSECCFLSNTFLFLDVFEVQGILMYISKNYALEM